MSQPVDISQFDKRCYENTGNSTIGVVILQEFDGRPHGIPLGFGERVWLNEIEERLTRNAPKSAADNPFANGDLKLVDSTAAQAAEEVPTQVVPSEPPPEPPSQDLAPSPDLPPSALPPAQSVPAPQPPQEGSLEDAALEAAEAAKESGEAPTSDHSAPEKVVDQIDQGEEETAVDQHTAETGVAVKPEGDAPEGSFKDGEEVATPDAPAKVAEETGKGGKTKPNYAKKS